MCAPATPLARAWATAFDADPAASASDGLPCAFDCSDDDGCGTPALFPGPGDDAPLSLKELPWDAAFDMPGDPALGDDVPLSPLELLWDTAFGAPVDSPPEEPMLPSFELLDSPEKELEPACGELLDSSAPELEGVFSAPGEPGFPKYEVPTRKLAAALLDPARGTRPGGGPAPVGTE